MSGGHFREALNFRGQNSKNLFAACSNKYVHVNKILCSCTAINSVSLLCEFSARSKKLMNFQLSRYHFEIATSQSILFIIVIVQVQSTK
jgi:hypothetical protein